MNREGASALMARIAEEMDGMASEEPKSIDECYDLVHHCPSPEYRGIYLRVKDRLAEMGLPLE